MKKDFIDNDYYTQIRIKFTCFINIVIKNVSINYKKRNKLIKEKEIEYDEQNIKDIHLPSDSDISFFNALEKNYTFKNLEDYFSNPIVYMAIKQLDDIQKKVLYYKILKNYDYKSIAKLLNISEANARNIKLRAIRKIKEIVERRKQYE